MVCLQGEQFTIPPSVYNLCQCLAEQNLFKIKHIPFLTKNIFFCLTCDLKSINITFNLTRAKVLNKNLKLSKEASCFSLGKFVPTKS
jgi:hypothetical protein